MNIFHIPSWYPSVNNPIYGTFIQEQISMLANETPNWNHGVSLWAQGDPDHMLWARHHLFNTKKVLKRRSYYSEQIGNITYFHQPTLTWTRLIMKGNLKRLLEVNDQHFQFYLKRVRSVDVIHAQATYPAALIACHLAERYDIPYFVSIRMSPFPFDEFLSQNKGLKDWIKFPLEKAKGLLAPSHSLARRLVEFGFENVHVLPNPVDTDFFRPSNNKEPQQITAFTVGRMVEQKGIDILIKAIHEQGEKSSMKFRIGGEGPKLLSYQHLATKLGVSDRIEWLGALSREQVRNEMQNCSFYILPSRHETFGNVLLEALACGKPVISTKCGGPEDIVTDKNGLLCETDHTAISQGLYYIQTNLLRYNGDQIVDDIMENYSSENFSDRIQTVFSQ